MRVLVVDEWVPFPLDSGKKIRTFCLLAPLALRHEITYLCYADARADASSIAHMKEAGFRMVCVPPANRFQTPITLAAGLTTNLFLRTPLAVRKHYSPGFEQAVKDLLAKETFDVAHCEWTHYAPYLQTASHLPRFLSSHNVECMQWHRFYQVQTNPFRKAAIHLEWLKMRAFERRAVAWFDHVAVVSVEDARAMKSFGARSVDVIPNGVDNEYYERTNVWDEGEVLVYCASMDSFVNQDAAIYFVKSVLPKIHEKRPRAEFMIVGKSPPASIRNLAGDRVIVTGSVEDVRPLLRKATISVVPLRIAGGSRLKILEAFAAAIPVVSTSIGAEGLEVVSGTHLLIADDDVAFAASCIHLLEDPSRRDNLVRAAECLAKEKYDWKAISPLVERAWERALYNAGRD